LIGELLGDERSRVRIGTVALVETLKIEDVENILLAIPGLAKLLRDRNATIRGDAAYLLGVIGHKGALPFLASARDDEHDLVRETIEEAIHEIHGEEGDG
jgi:HEAT repeat protein